MSEKKTKKPVVDETVESAEEKKPATKKEGKPVKEKNDNIFKRAGRKVKGFMSDHPFISAAVSAGVGSGLTVGACEVGRRAINRRQQRNQCVQQDNNSLDPNI